MIAARDDRGLRALLTSRLIDQAGLAAASLALAARLGPSRYVTVAMLLVTASVAVQLSDLGIGFAVMSSRSGTGLRLEALRRLRLGNAGLVVGAGLVALAIGQILVLASGLIWALTAEAYVRRAACLVGGSTGRAARAEVAGAIAAAAVAAIAIAARSADLMGLALVARYAVEAGVAGSAGNAFSTDGRPLGVPWEWLGQGATFATANIDYALIGAGLGGIALSLYSVAFRVASGVPALTAIPLTQHALVELSTERHSVRRQALVPVVMRRASRVGLLGLVSVAVAAPLLPVVLGDAWEETGRVAMVLALAVPVRMFVGPLVSTLLAERRRSIVVPVELARLATVALAVGGAVVMTDRLVVVAAAAAVATGAGVLLAAVVVQSATDHPVLRSVVMPALLVLGAIPLAAALS